MPHPLLGPVRARRGHFRFESGHHADYWLDLETLCRRPASVRPFAHQLAMLLRPYGVDAVCGPLNEGAFVALMVASDLDRDFSYAERVEDRQRGGLFPIDYRLPRALHPVVRGRRVAVVNDVISAGSAVRGTVRDLAANGATVVAIASLLVFGIAIDGFAEKRGIPLEALERLPGNAWTPAECPLCLAGMPIEATDP